MSRVVTPEKTSRPQSVLRDPTAGFIKIPVATKPQSRSCCCGDDRCKGISKAWRLLGDLRGTMFQLPSVSRGTRQQGQRITKEERLARINVHLKSNSTGSFDTRCHVKEPLALTTRQAKKERQRLNKYFAAHHIDPIILSELGRNKDTVPLSFLKENGLWGNGFTDADKVKHLDGDPQCYVVPSYSIESTKHDLGYVQRKEHLNSLIEKVIEGQRGKYQR